MRGRIERDAGSLGALPSAEARAREPAAARTPSDGRPPVTLGLRANLSQFSLLVLINAFVGGMVERAARHARHRAGDGRGTALIA